MLKIRLNTVRHRHREETQGEREIFNQGPTAELNQGCCGYMLCVLEHCHQNNVQNVLIEIVPIVRYGNRSEITENTQSHMLC